jgi:hypothetical protein
MITSDAYSQRSTFWRMQCSFERHGRGRNRKPKGGQLAKHTRHGRAENNAEGLLPDLPGNASRSLDSSFQMDARSFNAEVRFALSPAHARNTECR